MKLISILFAVLLLSACMNKTPEEAITPQKPEGTVQEPESKETTSAPAPTPVLTPTEPSQQPVSEPTTSSSPSKPAASVPTEEQIKQKYHAELSELQSYYTGKLSGLYDQALQDIKAGSSAKTLYGQYAKQAGVITEESHVKVNQLLEKMKAELLANGYPLSGVDQYRSIYHQEIGRAKSEAMQKLKSAVGFK